MELQTGLTDGTIVTFAGGSLAETARVLLVAEASGQVLVVTDRTPFHPQSLTWPDQPGDRGSLALADGGLVTVRDSREAVLNVATGMLLAGDAAQGQKRGDPDLRAVVLHWLDAGPVPKLGEVVGLTVDQTYRDALSLQHTGVHLAALALNQCAAPFWTKEGQDPDTLGFPNLDQAAVTRSEIGVSASLDVYRLGKSLRKKGFDRDAFVADLSDRAATINATLTTMLASPAPVSLTPTEGQLGDRRFWSTELNGRPVSMPCGGTHVADLSQIARITVTLEPVEDGFAMRTTTH
jgi:alanyl-tRNA synthetase